MLRSGSKSSDFDSNFGIFLDSKSLLSISNFQLPNISLFSAFPNYFLNVGDLWFEARLLVRKKQIPTLKKILTVNLEFLKKTRTLQLQTENRKPSNVAKGLLLSAFFCSGLWFLTFCILQVNDELCLCLVIKWQ